MSEADDPRVFFAAERTLLAWVRTGLTVMGLGFVVARFGLFLQMLQRSPDAPPRIGSTIIGVALVLLGSTAVALAARQHVRFCRTLGPGARPQPALAAWSVWFAGALTLLGVVLAAYILFWSKAS
jgi:putative membrane protein